METQVLASWTLLKTVLFQCLITRRTAVNLSYKILGDSPTDPDYPPVFLFHGLLESKKNWDSLGKTILNMTKRSVVAVDLRNHGDSPHVNSHKYEDMVQDILQLFDKLAVDKASVIGNNMGGRACMSLALLAPQKVAGLLVVDISPKSTASHFSNFYRKILLAMVQMNLKGEKKKKKARKEAKKTLKRIIDDDYLLDTVLDNVQRHNGLGWTCNLEILIKDFDYIASFPPISKKLNYKGPTLFLGGQASDYIPPDDLNAIREYFPKAVIQYINKAGHNPHQDDPRTFLEKALPFIRKHNF